MKIILIDSTLREGKQSLYCHKINELQSEYISIISRFGINEVEYCNPSINNTELNIFKKYSTKYNNIKFYTHIFLNKNNIDWVVNDPNVQFVSTFIKYPITVEKLIELNNFLNICNKKIRIAIENITFVTNKDIVKIIKLLNQHGNVSRICFSDTTGKFTPTTIVNFLKKIERIEGITSKDIEFHLHNDYGLAAGNFRQILDFNFKKIKTIYVSVCMFGIGERNGILSYGDVISNLINSNCKYNYNLAEYEKLNSLFVKNGIFFFRDPISISSFTHVANSHIEVDILNGKYTNIDPSLFGMKKTYIFGPLTGHNIYNKLASNFLTKSEKIKDEFEIKKYVCERMKKDRKEFCELNEILKYIKDLFKK